MNTIKFNVHPCLLRWQFVQQFILHFFSDNVIFKSKLPTLITHTSTKKYHTFTQSSKDFTSMYRIIEFFQEPYSDSRRLKPDSKWKVGMSEKSALAFCCVFFLRGGSQRKPIICTLFHIHMQIFLELKTLNQHGQNIELIEHVYYHRSRLTLPAFFLLSTWKRDNNNNNNERINE